MMCLKPWCTSGPQPCAKYFGLVEIALSLVGIIILLCLPFLVMKLDVEVTYIQERLLVDTRSNATSTKNCTLITINIFELPCNTIVDNIQKYFKDHLGNLTLYVVTLNNAKMVNGTIRCEIHLTTSIHPFKTFKVTTAKAGTNYYTMAGILAEAVFKYTHEPVQKIKDKMIVVGADEISVMYLYPGKIGTDPERKQCITVHMANAKAKDVQSDYDIMFHLFMISAVCSFVTGALVTVTEFKVNQCLVVSALVLEFICLAPLGLAVFVANQPSLCMLQHGGVSPEAADAPQYLQSMITYAAVGYTVVYKAYCIWYLAAHACVLRKIRSLRRDSFIGEMSQSEDDMEKTARVKAIQRLMGKDEGGSMLSDSLMSSSDEKSGATFLDKKGRWSTVSAADNNVRKESDAKPLEKKGRWSTVSEDKNISGTEKDTAGLAKKRKSTLVKVPERWT